MRFNDNPWHQMPFFRITIGNKELPGWMHDLIEEVRYEDVASGARVCTVTINDPLMKLVDNKLFVQNAPFKLIGGYQGWSEEKMRGFISTVDYQFPDDGTPQLVLNILDYSQIFNREKITRNWKNMSRFDIVKKICQEYGMVYKGQWTDWSGKVEEDITQSEQTDMQFIQQLAEDINFLISVSHDMLWFIEKAYEDKPYVAYMYRGRNPLQPIYGFDIISADIRVVVKEKVKAPWENEEEKKDDKDKQKAKK